MVDKQIITHNEKGTDLEARRLKIFLYLCHSYSCDLEGKHNLCTPMVKNYVYILGTFSKLVLKILLGTLPAISVILLNNLSM